MAIDKDELFAVLKEHPLELANVQAVAAKKLESSASIGQQGVRLFRELIDAVDQIVTILGEAGAERPIIEARIAAVVQQVAAMAAASPITPARREVLDPFVAAVGYIPQSTFDEYRVSAEARIRDLEEQLAG